MFIGREGARVGGSERNRWAGVHNWSQCGYAGTQVMLQSPRIFILLAPLVLNRKYRRPNPSVEATRNGMAPWPCDALVHHAPHGQGDMPPRAPHLQR